SHLQLIQNSAARVLSSTRKKARTIPILKSLHWLPVSLMSPNQGLLSVPQSSLKTKGDRAFAVMALKLWNCLPSNLRSLDSVDSFKKQLKTHLFTLAFVVFYTSLCTLFLSVAFILVCFVEFILCFIVTHFVTLVLERCYINKFYLLTFLL
ncbi:hypothetical protein LDENG_00087890, partial [Lucifuga dentata]